MHDLFMKQKSLILVIVVLIVLLVIAFSYIGYSIYSQWSLNAQVSAYNGGARDGLQQGYEQAVLQIMGQASSCQQVPLFANNQTITLIAVECL
jgi:flagellar basal body-associated protein FliL|tara:strand:- start:1257 stop:1535 length:279 start_codon:yes stop_codon:yes gene_type:complete